MTFSSRGLALQVVIQWLGLLLLFLDCEGKHFYWLGLDMLKKRTYNTFLFLWEITLKKFLLFQIEYGKTQSQS